MLYTVQLTHGQTCGQIPVKNDQGEIVNILKGNLNEYNQPIILTDINHNEIGRLYLDSNHGAVISLVLKMSPLLF